MRGRRAYRRVSFRRFLLRSLCGWRIEICLSPLQRMRGRCRNGGCRFGRGECDGLEIGKLIESSRMIGSLDAGLTFLIFQFSN